MAFITQVLITLMCYSHRSQGWLLPHHEQQHSIMLFQVILAKPQTLRNCSSSKTTFNGNVLLFDRQIFNRHFVVTRRVVLTLKGFWPAGTTSSECSVNAIKATCSNERREMLAIYEIEMRIFYVAFRKWQQFTHGVIILRFR